MVWIARHTMAAMFAATRILPVLVTSLASIAAAQTTAPHRPTTPLPRLSGGNPLVHELRVMSFNVWVGGANVNGGLQKIVDAIVAADADVVGIQESSATAVWVAQELGWYSYMPSTGSVAVVSRFPITETFPLTLNGAGTGVRLQLNANPPQDVIFWSCHLTADPYGPYQACFDGATTQVIIDTQNVTQLPEIQDVLFAMAPQLVQKDQVPLIIVGDFNTPSHLDWIPGTAAQHCGYVVPYPVTLAMQTVGLLDAYRTLFPDPAADPANTWSTIFPFNDDVNQPEPQDRIDQVHFAGSGVEPLDAAVFVVGNPADWPNHASNAWPSDHAGVVVDFAVRPTDGAPLPLPSLTLDGSTFAVGEEIGATFARGPGNARDWIGIYPITEAPGLFSSTAWYYTNNTQNAGAGSGPNQGTVTFGAGSAPTWPLPPGQYNAYFLCCDGYAVSAGPVAFEVL
ncbi:MAG: hypothetical protein CMJ89_03110 [Planctomycetes bacterium]|nr:hypothetical protein [Planctomycetota bacterium]